MLIEIQAKSKEDDGWDTVKLSEMVGETLRDALLGFDGKQIVVEIDIDGGKHYCCGTDALRAVMAPRGRAVTSQDAGRLFDQINPRILEICTGYKTVEKTFEGCRLEKITIDIPGHTEQQTTFFTDNG